MPRPSFQAVVLSSLLLGLVCHTMVPMVESAAGGHNHGGAKDDPHGGVPMGIPSKFCDDGKSYTAIDWDSASIEEHTCDRKTDSVLERNSYSSCEAQAKRPIHVCYPEVIRYDEDIPTSGHHRPLWPKYGEYRYLPPQRWLHSLEHGAIVFLYHPCADPRQVSIFKSIARHCLRRHIITPSKRIPSPNMFVLASWMCKLVMTQPDIDKMVSFIRTHALHSPEKSVHADGQYSIGLTHHAKMVSDLAESSLCPGLSQIAPSAAKILQASSRRQSRLKQMTRRLETKVLPKIDELLRDWKQ